MKSGHLIGPVEYKGRYGFINHSGEFAIDPVFEALGQFKEGLACFRKEGRFGFINSKGETTIAAVFESDNLAGPRFSSGLAAVGRYGKVGYISHAGEFVIPEILNLGWDFIGEFAFIERNISGKPTYAVMDKNGSTGAKLDVSEIPHIPDFPMDWNCFGCFFKVDPDLIVFMNWKGEVVFPPRFPAMTDFFAGIAGFSETREGPDDLYGLVAMSGEVVRQPGFIQMSDFEEGLARAGRAPKEFGFINSHGDWVIEPKFRQAQPFSEGLACVTVHDNTRRGKKGFTNRRGELVIEPRFDCEVRFHDGFAQVEYEGKRAVIDKTGRVIWETEVESERGTA